MNTIVYSMYDLQEGEMHVFTSPATALVKDVVAAYFTDKVIPSTFGSEGVESEEAKNLLTLLSQAGSIEDVKAILFQYDFIIEVTSL